MAHRGLTPALLLAVLLSGCSTTAPAASSSTQAAAPSARASAPATTPASPSVHGAGPDDYQQTRDRLLALERARGPAAALAELDRLQAAEPAVAGFCHALAHDLGHAALAASDGSVARAMRYRDDVCGGGYIHGVIEVALGSSTNPARDLLRVCRPAQDGSCWHGVGHGVMFATGMDVGESLRLCDKAPTATLSARCGEGVFMQLFAADTPGGHDPSAKAPVLAAVPGLCGAVRARYAANCWFYAPTVWLAGHPDDFAGAMGWCRGLVDPLGRRLCARGVGSRTIKYHPDDPSIGASVCAQAGEQQDSCLAGMGSYWSVHFKGRRQPTQVCAHLAGIVPAARCRVAIARES